MFVVAPSAWRGQKRRGRHAFETDSGKLAGEARFVGIFALRINARISPLQVVLRYRDLLQVETLFRQAKAIRRTRPIDHSSDAAIRGLSCARFRCCCCRRNWRGCALKEGARWSNGPTCCGTWAASKEATIEKDGKRISTRTHVEGQVGLVFQAAGIALPATFREHPA